MIRFLVKRLFLLASPLRYDGQSYWLYRQNQSTRAVEIQSFPVPFSTFQRGCCNCRRESPGNCPLPHPTSCAAFAQLPIAQIGNRHCCHHVVITSVPRLCAPLRPSISKPVLNYSFMYRFTKCRLSIFYMVCHLLFVVLFHPLSCRCIKRPDPSPRQVFCRKKVGQ